MTKLDRSYAPHLFISEMPLPPGEEWTPGLAGWSLIQVGSGNGYWIGPQANRELPAGTVILLAPEVTGSLRASQLGGLSLCFFTIVPKRLTGLLTLGEQTFFETAASREELSFQAIPPPAPVAGKMKELCAIRNQGGLWYRLQLLQLFMEIFRDELDEGTAEPGAMLDARERLEEFLRQTPASELLHMNFSQLADTMRCTPRHLSRVFHEVAGMSFREKHAELRLARARELLATTESKVVDIALESGYQSLSLFNLMFTRRFGMSPGKWREARRNDNAPRARARAELAVSR